MKTFFLKDIRSLEYRNSLSPEDQGALDKYLEEMKQGPGDGEMDIEWQETGRGYYVHIHCLEALPVGTEKSDYLKAIQEDIKMWLAEEPKNYMVGNVREMLERKR